MLRVLFEYDYVRSVRDCSYMDEAVCQNGIFIFALIYVDSRVEAGITGRFLYDISIHILIIQIVNNIISAQTRLEIHTRDVRSGY